MTKLKTQIWTVVIVTVVTVAVVTLVIVIVVTGAVVTEVIVSYFSKNNLTSQQPMFSVLVLSFFRTFNHSDSYVFFLFFFQIIFNIHYFFVISYYLFILCELCSK